MGCIPKSNFEKILGELQKLGIQDADPGAIDEALVVIRKQRGSFQGLRKRDFVELIVSNLKSSSKRSNAPNVIPPAENGDLEEPESQEENNNSRYFNSKETSTSEVSSVTSQKTSLCEEQIQSSISNLITRDQEHENHRMLIASQKNDAEPPPEKQNEPVLKKDSPRVTKDLKSFPSIREQTSGPKLEIPRSSKSNILPEATPYASPAPVSATILTNPFDVPQVLTSRVLIKDVVEYVVDKHKHLNVSKWEVISILRIILSSSTNHTFDSFKDVASLILVMEREIASNREFCAMLENVSCGFTALNSLSNGSFKLNAIPDESSSYSATRSSSNSLHHVDHSFCNGARVENDHEKEPEKAFNWNDYMFANVAPNDPVCEKSNLRRSDIDFSSSQVPNFPNFMNSSPESTESYEVREVLGKAEPTEVSSNDNLPGQQSSSVPNASVPARNSASYLRSSSVGSQNPPPGFEDFATEKSSFSNPHSINSSRTSLSQESNSRQKTADNKAPQKVRVILKDSIESLNERGQSRIVNLDMLPVLQRRNSDASKVSCVQCQNGLVSGTGKLEALKCGHVMHKSCVKNNTLGCPSHCTAKIKKTTSEDVDLDKGDWCVVPIKKSVKSIEVEQPAKNSKDDKDGKKKQKKKKPSMAKSLGAAENKSENSTPQNKKETEPCSTKVRSEEDITITQESYRLEKPQSCGENRANHSKKPTNSAWKQIDVPTTFESYDEVECPICYHSLNLGIAMELVCKHVFHSHCLDRWYRIQGKSCPLCRKVAMTPNEYPALN